jgi:hypothetical protein
LGKEKQFYLSKELKKRDMTKGETAQTSFDKRPPSSQKQGDKPAMRREDGRAQGDELLDNRLVGW